jgi:hypothetical protein
MSSSKQATTNPEVGGGVASSSGTGDKKEVISGFLNLVSRDSGAAVPGKEGKPDAYPSALNFEQALDNIIGPIAKMLDNSEFPPEALKLLDVTNPSSPFSKLRTQVLSALDTQLAAAKRFASTKEGGAVSTFESIANAWAANSKGLDLNTACDGGGNTAKIVTAAAGVKSTVVNFKKVCTC